MHVCGAALAHPPVLIFLSLSLVQKCHHRTRNDKHYFIGILTKHDDYRKLSSDFSWFCFFFSFFLIIILWHHERRKGRKKFRRDPLNKSTFFLIVIIWKQLIPRDFFLWIFVCVFFFLRVLKWRASAAVNTCTVRYGQVRRRTGLGSGGGWRLHL